MSSRFWKIGIASLGIALMLPRGANAQTGAAQPVSGGASPQVAQPDNGGVNWKGAGVGAATLLANVGYIPAKTVYAILGGIAGGAGYALTGGNQQTANSIWRSSLGGDYVLTPAMIQGNEPIHFSGPSTAPANQTSSYTPPSTAPVAPNPPPVTASSAPVYPSTTSYPNTATSSSTAAGVGAPPLSVSTTRSSSSHFSTSITGPGDSGTGPVREHDIE